MKNTPTALGRAILLASSFLMLTGALGAAPATPVQVSPPNEAVDLPTQVTVQWAETNLGETYRVQIATSSDFRNPVTDEQVENTVGFTVFNLAKGTVYFWRISASAGGQTSPFSPVWAFRITDREIPGVPTLVSPANGATGVPRSPTLVWNAVADADSYDVDFQPLAGPGFDSQHQIAQTSITFNQVDLSYTNHFRWRVRSRNPAGVSDWSETRDFFVSSP